MRRASVLCLYALLLTMALSGNAFAGHVDTAFNPAHLKAINREREKYGLNPVTMSRTMNKAIAIRAKEQEELYGHSRPDGRDCWSVLGDVDPNFEWSPSGENCFKGPNTVAMAMEGWMNSSGHRANILSSECKRVGIATYVDDNGMCYWVQMFSRNAPDEDYYGEYDGDNGGDGGYRNPLEPTSDSSAGCSSGFGVLALMALAVFAMSRKG